MVKFRDYASWATLITAFVVLWICIYWLVYPYKTVTFHNLPFPVDQKIYKPGECLRIYTEYTRYTDIQSIAVIRFTDGITFTMLPMVFQKSPGTYKGYSLTVRIPDVLPPGRYFLDVNFTYEMNPLRDIVVNARTQEFTVK